MLLDGPQTVQARDLLERLDDVGLLGLRLGELLEREAELAEDGTARVDCRVSRPSAADAPLAAMKRCCEQSSSASSRPLPLATNASYALAAFSTTIEATQPHAWSMIARSPTLSSDGHLALRIDLEPR